MSNPSSAMIADLDIHCGCSPDPVTATGATHDVKLHNTGLDRYARIHMTVSVWMPVQGCGLALRQGQKTATVLPGIPLGTLPGGKTCTWAVDVVRVPGGATQYETIKTVVEFVSDRDLDPLDDSPDTVPVNVSPVVKIDVALA